VAKKAAENATEHAVEKAATITAARRFENEQSEKQQI